MSLQVSELLKLSKDQIASSLDQFVGQQNDAHTRDNVAFVIEMYLLDLKQRADIREFKVICDITNNSLPIIESNQMICDVYIRPAAWSGLYNIRAAVIGNVRNLDSTILTKKDYETRYDYAMVILGKK